MPARRARHTCPVNGLLAAGLLGLLAGLGIAMPLGAIATLLLRTGITSGARVAGAGALGVAVVDTGYASLAVLAGSGVTALIGEHAHAVRLVGAAVLAWIALRGLWRARHLTAEDADLPTRTGAGAGAAFARFAGLTVLNPVTAIYFAVLIAGFGSRLGAGVGHRVAFVLGVALASAGWQLGLAGVGALLGRSVGARTRRWIGVSGDLVVLALAVALAAY